MFLCIGVHMCHHTCTVLYTLCTHLCIRMCAQFVAVCVGALLRVYVCACAHVKEMFYGHVCSQACGYMCIDHSFGCAVSSHLV